MKKAGRLLSCVVLCSLVILTLPLWLEAYSYVRVVRLSLVDGGVYVEQPGSSARERGLVNLPVVHDAVLATTDGFAEVEFESGAYARLAAGSRLHFKELGLLDNGGRVTVLVLEEGTASFNAQRRGDDIFRVLTPDFEVSVPKRARFRIDLTADGARLRVFSGEVNLESPAGSLRVTKGKMVEWNSTTQNYALARNPARDGWDDWNEERDDAVQVSAPGAVPANLRYGVFDLAHYGGWTHLPGFGSVWQPWVAAGWMPFSYGRWGWYPQFGWTWISFEPWGWLPYHYGSWYYDPFLGWVWVPDYFSAWSAARCSWFRQPGWIGWAPLAPQRVSGGQIQTTGTQTPTGGVVVTEGGFGRGEVPRLAQEVAERTDRQWQLISGPSEEATRSFQRTRAMERLQERLEAAPAATIRGRSVTPGAGAVGSIQARPTRESGSGETRAESGPRIARRPLVPAGGQVTGGAAARAERTERPRPSVAATPERVGSGADRRVGAARAEGARERPRATFSPRSDSSREARQPAPRPMPSRDAAAPRPAPSPSPSATPRSSPPPRPSPPPKPSQSNQ